MSALDDPSEHRGWLETTEGAAILEDFGGLWGEAEKIWTARQDDPAFFAYVSADYDAVLYSLLSLRGKVSTFLEWGSGLGVVTIMASRLGFEAYGIESEWELVDFSRSLADVYGPNAQIGHGSFIPDAFRWNPAAGDEVCRTVVDEVAAYEHLDRNLDEFDLVYAYPWPDEHELYRHILREFGQSDVKFLTYDAREGMSITDIG